MKNLTLSYGWKWLRRFLACAIVAILFTWIVYPGVNNHNHFELLIPGINVLVADTGILLLGCYLSYKLAPVIANNIFRKIQIRPELLSICLMGIGLYLIVTDLLPELNNVSASLESVGITQNSLLEHIRTNSFDFWWMLLARLVLPVAIVYLPVTIAEWINRIKDTQWYRQAFIEGKGAGSKWAGPHTFKRLRCRVSLNLNSNSLLLGRALFADDPGTPIIAAEPESHIITSGLTGSGKGVTAIYSNIVNYGGSILINDPKGELAMQTMRTRSSKKWLKKHHVTGKTFRHKSGDARAYVLDPFKETKGLPLFYHTLLSEIDITNDRSRELIYAIADGCILPEGKENAHFYELSKDFLAGLIAHVLSHFPKERHTLPFILDLLSGIDPDLGYGDPTRLNELLKEMLKNKACGGLVQAIASKVLEVGDREKGSILSTTARGLMWSGDPAMRVQLSCSDFSFSELKERVTTIYLVLPDGLMSSQHRWLRCMISLSIALAKKTDRSKGKDTLFLLDELPRLKSIKAVAEGFEFLRGYGIRIWGFVQDLSQIAQDYPKRYETILGNATIQIFGVNSTHTADYVSKMAGSAIVKKTSGKGKDKQVQENIRPLLTPTEVKIKLGKNSNRCIVFPTEGFPMRLERCSFKPMRLGKKRFFEFTPFAFWGCFESRK